MSHETDLDSPYDGLLEDVLVPDDPLAGVDAPAPEGVDPSALARYCLMLGDDALIASHRLSEWCSNAPEMEDDVALANVALDLLGQARLLMSRAAALDPAVVPRLPAGSPVPPEDALAFFRDPPAFTNVALVEPDNGDFAATVVRMVVFSTFRLALLSHLRESRDPVLAAIAAKGVKEVTYHRDYAARWLVTLALGTAESRRRTEAATVREWRYVPALFVADDVERALAAAGVAVDPSTLRDEVDDVLAQVLAAGELERPPLADVPTDDGRRGRHTEAFAPMLATMQSLARAHPTGRW